MVTSSRLLLIAFHTQRHVYRKRYGGIQDGYNNSKFIGTTKGFTQFALGPASVSITGCTYHRMLDAQTPNHSLHWFLYDESERVRRGEQWDVPVQWVRAMKETLDDINPYIWNLHQFTDIS